MQEAMQEIESHQFSAYLNAASDLETFLHAAHQQEAVRVLTKELDLEAVRFEVLARILELCKQRVDPRYENPWDAALTIYVWLLNSKNWDMGRIAAEAVRGALQCWWAARMARRVLLEEQRKNDATVERVEFPSEKPRAVRADRHVGEALLTTHWPWSQHTANRFRVVNQVSRATATGTAMICLSSPHFPAGDVNTPDYMVEHAR